MTCEARRVHVVVVAYRGAVELGACLASVEHELRVTVIDNSSSNEVHDVAIRQGAEYVDATRNVGFASGVNLALRKLMSGSPQDMLLLNPDAVLAPETVEQLVGCLYHEGNERIAAVSPHLTTLDGTSQRVAWPFPTPTRTWLEAVGLGRLPARHTFVVGAVLLLRWEALVEVGLFDERFFLYAEEADWQRRALAMGWRSQVCADTVVAHRGAGTSSDPRRRETLFHAGQETYIRKWFGSTGWAFYRAGACLGAVARAAVLRGDRRAEAARRALLYFRGPLRSAALAHDR